MLWDGPSAILFEFLEHINSSNTFNLKFTMTYDACRISFLDLTIIKHPDGSLQSELYRKPTAGNTILEASSLHPKPLLASIPF